MPKRIEPDGAIEIEVDGEPRGPREQPPRDHMTSEIDQIVAGMRKLGEQEVKGVVDQGAMKVGIHMTKSNVIIWIGLHDLKADIREKGLSENIMNSMDDFAWATAYTAWRATKSVSVQEAYQEAPMYPQGALPSQIIDPDATPEDKLKKHAPKRRDRFDLI